ncbi:SWI5-dependent HO expression protein 4, partial [Dipsacomyces acuminosporus]
FKFFISQLWLIGSLPASAVNEFRNVGQGALRLLTVNKPLFIHTFVAESASLSKNSRNKGAISPLERLLYILGDGGEDLGGKQPLAVLIASQLVPAAKDPANSSMFPGYNPATVRSAGALPIALTQMRSLATLILDSWVQSDIQAERSRGLLSMASLYEAGVGSDLTADLWLKNGWAEDLWDQGEFDKQETQLALLKLANESSTDVNIGKQMKKFGNGLVQALVRKGSSKGANEMDSRLADAAAIVLSKWSGAPKTAASAGSAATALGQPDNEQGSGITELPSEPSVDDMDPLQLADMHIRRITECTTKPGSDDAAAAAAAAVEKATEALGYLCLKPRLKEHVSQNSSLLKSLFSFAQKQPSASLKFSTSMLIRNLTQYRPVLTEEQKRMQQLQQLSRRAQQKSPGKDGDKPTTVGDELKQAEADDDGDDEEGKKLDSAEHVSKRAALLCNAGCISVLVSAVQPKQHPSDNIKDAVAEIMVALATTQTLRGLIVQQGGVRALLSIATKDAPKASSSKTAAAARSYTPQALRQQRDRNIALSLAKIAISTPPHLAFSDPREIVRLLLSLLAEESDSQAMLMRFEALLALTNLASSDPGSAYDVRGYMANDLNGIGLVEMIMLSDHPLIRRASTELVCNLIYEPSVFERYAKNADKSIPKATSDDVDAPAEVLPSGIVELASDDDGDGHGDAGLGGSDSDAYRSHRLHLLVALSDVDDAQTRSAASGALAVLSNDPGCCRYLFLAHPRAPDVLLALAQDSSVDAQMQAAFKHRETNKGEGRVVGCGNSHPTIFEGVDIARGLNAVLIKKHLPVRVTSTTNCAISTLVISRHRLNKTSVALVLNRGINAAYYEDASKIAKLSDTELGKSESRVAINTELAYYGKHSQILRHTQWDNRIDRESDNPGDRIFEKLVADKYLGEIVRNLITDFVDAQLLFSKSADSTVLSSEYSFYTSYMTIMEDSSPDLSDIGDLLASGFNIQSSVVDRRIIRALCHIVTLRAARLVGAASAAVVKKALEALPAKEPALASISGQLTEMNQPYVECVKSTAERLLAGYGVGNAEFYILGEDGYTVGAALTSLGS